MSIGAAFDHTPFRECAFVDPDDFHNDKQYLARSVDLRLEDAPK